MHGCVTFISCSLLGELHPDEIDLPGVYVQKIVKGESYEKRIEKLTLRKDDDSTGATTNPSRDRIVRRAAKEFKDGMYVNLGKITFPHVIHSRLLKSCTIMY